MKLTLGEVRGILLDLDGVTWIGTALAPGADRFWHYAQTSELPVAFVSNASAASRASIYAKLKQLGLANVSREQIFPATRAAALYVCGRRPHPRVFLVGEVGLADELRAAGAELVEEGADFVVVGVDRQATYARLERAADQLIAGAELVTTNSDGNYPTERGLKPAAGPFARFLEMASGVQATIIGKPQAELLHQALIFLKLDPWEALMVGDRAEADVVAARAAGVPAVLIGDQRLEALPPELQPDLFCRDLGELTTLLAAARD